MKIYEKKPKEEAVISFKEILRAALELPPVQRAMLADLLLESLDGPDQMEIDDAWSREAERRMEEIRTGKVETIDGELVMEELSSDEQKRIDDLWAQEAES